MDSTGLLKTFRFEVVDQEEPHLWSDEEALGYLDDAQKMFCRRTGGLGDASTPEVTQIAYTDAASVVPTSKLILKFRDAYLVGRGHPVSIINREDMPRLGLRFDGRLGTPRYLIIGMEPNKATIYPAPDPGTSGVIQLIVDRLPLVKIDKIDQTLEVDDQHAHGLVMRMKALAYAKQDAETFDRTKSERFDAEFLTYCEMGRREKERAMHKTRVVEYGGV